MVIAKIVQWDGISGTTYPFRNYSLYDTEFNEVGCVYIYTKIENNKWVPIYVGQTCHLAQRIDEHATDMCERSNRCILKKNPTNIHVYRLEDEDTRKNVEIDIIRNYHWCCN